MNINNILITSTFFCLWLTSQIPEYAQYSIGLFFIFTLGILHGSNDISIVGKLKEVATQYFLEIFNISLKRVLRGLWQLKMH